MKTTPKKVLLSNTDLKIIKAFANHLKEKANPTLKSLKLKNTVILFQIARSLGYKNYEELKRYSTSKILFTDIYLYLAEFAESVLFKLLDPENKTNSKQKQLIKKLSKFSVLTFNFVENISDYVYDIEPSKQIDVHTVLVPYLPGHYETILFRSYLELALKLEQFKRHNIMLNSFIDKSISRKTTKLKPVIKSNYPVYKYISKLLPDDSIFIVNENEYVLGYNTISHKSVSEKLDFEKAIIMQLAFIYPSSFLYQVNESNDRIELECINPSFEKKIKIKKTKESKPKPMDGALVVEAMFNNPNNRHKIDTNISYKKNCDYYLLKTFGQIY